MGPVGTDVSMRTEPGCLPGVGTDLSKAAVRRYRPLAGCVGSVPTRGTLAGGYLFCISRSSASQVPSESRSARTTTLFMPLLRWTFSSTQPLLLTDTVCFRTTALPFLPTSVKVACPPLLFCETQIETIFLRLLN